MPNENEHPRYTDPDHPYSGSGLRYQNNYNRNEYHAGEVYKDWQLHLE